MKQPNSFPKSAKTLHLQHKGAFVVSSIRLCPSLAMQICTFQNLTKKRLRTRASMYCGFQLSKISDLIFSVLRFLPTFCMPETQASSCSRNLNINCVSESSAFLHISQHDPKSGIQKYWIPLQTLLHKWALSKKKLCGAAVGNFWML